MAKILIGNIKGPIGPQGPQGVQGPVGPQGPKGDTGPIPTLVNNGTTTQAGVAALDAAMGKTLTDKDADLQSQVNALNGKTDGLEEGIAEVDGKVVLNTTVPAPIASSGGSTVALEWTHSEGDTSEYLYFIVDGTPVAKIRGMTRIG